MNDTDAERTPGLASIMQTPPPTGQHQSRSRSRSRTPLPAEKANRLTKLLNSALKEEKKGKKVTINDANEKDSTSGRIKEMESRLAMCIKEYKKYKEECLELKAERASYIDEVCCSAGA
jgi:hypothetical protein